MNDETELHLFHVAQKVLAALRPLPDDDARRRVIQAAAILLDIDLTAVPLRTIPDDER